MKPGFKQTEIGVIPEDWACVKLLSICELLNGLTYTPENVSEFGTLVIRSSNIQNNRLDFSDNVYIDISVSPEKHIKKNDMIICIRNGSAALIGKSAKAEKDYPSATFGAFMAVLRGDNNDYIFQLFQQGEILKRISKNSGATINQITNGDFKSIVVPLPNSRYEQQCISKVLSDVDELIASLEKIIAKKKAIKQGVMQELLTGKRRLPGFTKEWKSRKLSSFCSLVTKQTGFDYSAYIKPALIKENLPDTLPMIQTINFRGKHFSFDTDYYIPKSVALQFPNIILNSKCVLFSIVGASVGNIGLYPGGTSFCGGAIGITRFFNEQDADWVFYYMSSPEGQSQINYVTKGGAQATVTIADIRNFIIPTPEEEERTAIVSVLSDLDTEILEIEGKLKKAQQVKRGMMQQLLSGKIRLI